MNLANDKRIYELFCDANAVDFSERRPHVYSSSGEPPLSTIFEDYEALSVCRGLDSRNAGFKAWKRQEGDRARPGDGYLIQKAAMEAVAHYGLVQISQLMALPTANFKSSRLAEAFSELDTRRKHTRAPLIRITFQDESADDEFTLRFRVRGGVLDEDTIVVRRRAGNELMHVTRSGVLSILPEAVVTPPILRLFIQFCDDSKSVIAHYGVKLGSCSFCGRELSSPRSLNAGYGPICAADQGYAY